MIIHCTKKLADKLPTANKEPLTDNEYFGSWHANLYVIDQRDNVMFCHDKTRFMFFITTLKKADLANLDFWFQDVFANTMLKMAYEPRLIEKAVSLLTPLQFDTNCSRSVQGTMRVARHEMDYAFMNYPISDIEDLPMYQFSAKLNHRPVTIKGVKKHLWPDKEMIKYIEAL